jgi:hypothetical protein
MYCPRCGGANDDRANRCANCGREMRAVVPPGADLGDDPVLRMVIPAGRSGYAIAAGYAGLFSPFCLLPAPFAVVLGVLAIRDIRRHPERHGMGRAVFGIAVGCAGLLALIALAFAKP